MRSTANNPHKINMEPAWGGGGVNHHRPYSCGLSESQSNTNITRLLPISLGLQIDVCRNIPKRKAQEQTPCPLPQCER